MADEDEAGSKKVNGQPVDLPIDPARFAAEAPATTRVEIANVTVLGDPGAKFHASGNTRKDAQDGVKVPLGRLIEERNDPFRLKTRAPGVFHLVDTALKFGSRLPKSLKPVPIDERLRQLRTDALAKKPKPVSKDDVLDHLKSFGEPFHTLVAREQAFRFINPQTRFNGDKTRKSFDPGLKSDPWFWKKYRRYEEIRHPLGLIIKITDELTTERLKNTEWQKNGIPASEVARRLTSFNFHGKDELSVLTAIIRWEAK